MPAWMDNSFWALVALIIFLGIAVYFGVPRIIGQMLDKRIKQISDELDEAKRLREEAAALLAEYEQKRVSAEKEAEEIVTAAKADAERMTADAQAALEDMITRLLTERPAGHGGRVSILVNSLGATPLEELLILYRHAFRKLKEAGLAIVQPLVGHYATSMEMAGASISLCFLDSELERLLAAPSDSPFWEVK